MIPESLNKKLNFGAHFGPELTFENLNYRLYMAGKNDLKLEIWHVIGHKYE